MFDRGYLKGNNKLLVCLIRNEELIIVPSCSHSEKMYIMEKVIYNLVFNRKKRLNAEGKALIQVEAYLNRQKKYFSTKIYVKPTQWDSKRRAVRNHPRSSRQYSREWFC